MNRPNGYEDVQAGGEFTPIELGGHTALIIGVEETKSSTGKNMIKVAIDFDGNDVQPFYFKNQFANDERPDKKWPYQAVQYILTEDETGKCSKSFKAFITSVERSNNSECQWGKGFSAWFKQKVVGAVYGEVEEEYNGEVKKRHRLRYFTEYAKAKDAKIPAAKLLDTAPATVQQNVNAGFITVPEDVKEDAIPF